MTDTVRAYVHITSLLACICNCHSKLSCSRNLQTVCRWIPTYTHVQYLSMYCSYVYTCMYLHICTLQVKLQDEVHKEVARRRGDVKKLQTEKDHYQKAVALLKDRIDSLHLLVSEKDILLTDATAEAEDLRGQVAVLEKAVSGYLKRGSSRSSPVPLPSAFRGMQESRDPLKSKKILRFADPVISHPPLKEATGRFEKPLTTSSQWSSVTEDHFAETQAIYERLRQVSKVLTYVCT